MYTALCSSLLFPLHERLKGHHSVSMHRELEASHWWPAERLLAAQALRLREFLLQVGRDVPDYRDLFARTGFDPATVQSVADLQGLPFLDKPTIRAAGDRLKSERAGKLIRYNTGGSSGEPLVFYMGMGRVSHDVAAKWRATRWWDVDIGDVEVVLWGSPIEIGKQDRIKARARQAVPQPLAAGVPDVGSADGSLSRPDHSPAPEDAVRLCVGAGTAGHACGAPRPRHAHCGHARSRSRPARPCTRRNARSSNACSALRSRTAMARATRASSRTSARQGSLHLSAEHIVVELVDETDAP